jgi:hypothetical protein
LGFDCFVAGVPGFIEVVQRDRSVATIIRSSAEGIESHFWG